MHQGFSLSASDLEPALRFGVPLTGELHSNSRRQMAIKNDFAAYVSRRGALCATPGTLIRAGVKP